MSTARKYAKKYGVTTKVARKVGGQCKRGLKKLKQGKPVPKMKRVEFGSWSVTSKKRVIRRSKTTKALKRKSCKRK